MSTYAGYIGGLSPNHSREKDQFVPKYCNLWRFTGDIDAKWERIIAPFGLADRLALAMPVIMVISTCSRSTRTASRL